MPSREPPAPPNSGDAESRLRLLIDAAPIAMMVVDRNGRIVLANRQTAKVFGYEETELLGRGLDLLVPESSRRLHHLQVESFFQAGVARVMGLGREVLAVDRQGREFPVEIGLTPIATPDGPQAVAAIIDITERKRVETESTLAHIVQQAMLPQSQPVLDGCDIFGTSKPAAATGGDFYDYISLPSRRLGVVVGDASGHGFAAALLTAAARSYLRAVSRIEHDVCTVLETANQLLVDDVPEGRFVTLFYAVVDPGRSQFTYAAAGQSGYLFGGDGSLKQTLRSTGPALGWLAAATFPTETIAAAPGDVLLLLTDGIEEAMSPGDELFGRQRVFDVIKDHVHEPAAEIIRHLLTAVRKFRSAQLDDMTAVAVKFGQPVGWFIFAARADECGR